MRYPSTSLASLLALQNLSRFAFATPYSVPSTRDSPLMDTCEDTDTSGTISMPIRYLYGGLNKITTSVMVGSENRDIDQGIEVVVDYGSTEFWVFRPNATINYGSQYLGLLGHCNTIPSIYYHPSPSGSPPLSNFSKSYSYGGNSKILSANASVNETLFFAEDSRSCPVPNIEVALVYKSAHRFYVPDNSPCPELSYDLGIMGLATSDSTDVLGPNIKTNLLDQGRISDSIVSMYFDATPADASTNYNFTGTLLFGSLPPSSSYEDTLVALPNVKAQGQIGYYISQPVISAKDITIPSNYPKENCLIDSGAVALTLPFGSDATAFFGATGLQGLQEGQGGVVYPTSCDDIPSDAGLVFEMAGRDGEEKVSVRVPLRNLARGSAGPEGATPEGKCVLNVVLGTKCVFGAPWLIGTAVGMDDEQGLVYVAQGSNLNL